MMVACSGQGICASNTCSLLGQISSDARASNSRTFDKMTVELGCRFHLKRGKINGSVKLDSLLTGWRYFIVSVKIAFSST